MDNARQVDAYTPVAPEEILIRLGDTVTVTNHTNSMSGRCCRYTVLFFIFIILSCSVPAVVRVKVATAWRFNIIIQVGYHHTTRCTASVLPTYPIPTNVFPIPLQLYLNRRVPNGFPSRPAVRLGIWFWGW